MTLETITPKHEVIRFGFGDIALGAVLVALSPRGVAAILLGRDHQRLSQDLAKAFPAADLVENDASAVADIAKVVAFVNAPQTGLDLPMDLRGSEFELAVWQALGDIPFGQTRSYGALAKILSVAGTAKEVGAACAANVLAVAVPCHRIIRADGGISGYRWGVARKRQLLEMERAS